MFSFFILILFFNEWWWKKKQNNPKKKCQILLTTLLDYIYNVFPFAILCGHCTSTCPLPLHHLSLIYDGSLNIIILPSHNYYVKWYQTHPLIINSVSTAAAAVCVCVCLEKCSHRNGSIVLYNSITASPVVINPRRKMNDRKFVIRRTIIINPSLIFGRYCLFFLPYNIRILYYINELIYPTGLFVSTLSTITPPKQYTWLSTVWITTAHTHTHKTHHHRHMISCK